MDQQHVQLLLIKGMVSELPEPERNRVNNTATDLRSVVNAAGDEGTLALALVSAEMAIGA